MWFRWERSSDGVDSDGMPNCIGADLAQNFRPNYGHVKKTLHLHYVEVDIGRFDVPESEVIEYLRRHDYIQCEKPPEPAPSSEGQHGYGYLRVDSNGSVCEFIR